MLITATTFIFLIFSIITFYNHQAPGLCSGFEGKPSYAYFENSVSFEKLELQCKTNIPEIHIHLKNKDFLILMKNRKHALEQLSLLPKDNEEIPATINFQGKSLTATLRLKGDKIDHFEEPVAWSLRIALKKQQHILSMNRFSLQRLQTRSNDIDPLYQMMMREQGIIAPRYQFVKVKINNIDWGLMEMEDHFTREIQEANRHKESIIAKLDETEMWEYVTAYYTMLLYNNSFVASTEFFSRKKIQNNAKFSQDATYAKSLMQAWQSGRLSTHFGFDNKTYNTFIAISELWGAWHPMAWGNLRFYYNPYLGKFEPVSFDFSEPSQETTLSHAEKFPLFNEIIFNKENTTFLESGFYETVNALANDNEISRLKKEQADLIHLLEKYNITPVADFEILRKNRNFINAKGKQFFAPTEKHWEHTPSTKFIDQTTISLARANVYHNGFIEIINKIPLPLTIKSITTSYLGINNNQLPITERNIKASELFGRAEPYLLFIDPDIKWDEITIVLESKTNIPQQTIKLHDNEKIFFLNDQYFIDKELHRNTIINSQAFIKQDETGAYHIIEGIWNVPEALEFPANATVIIDAGSHLRFRENSYLKTNGALHIQGTSSNPVSLSGINDGETWKGIFVVRSSEKSIWQWVDINNTQAHKAEPIEITGAITFYESDIEMDHVNFTNSSAEDMLNVVNAEFSLSNVNFRGGRSDAFDADFSRGKLINTHFENIKGDGFDTSGTESDITHCTFTDIKDKAISIGEVSYANIEDVSINQAGTAVAVKDYSRASIINSAIRQSTFSDLMSYTKKSAYGGALLIAENIQIDDRPVLISDSNSTLLFDKRRIPNTNVDIQTLYKTGPMQK